MNYYNRPYGLDMFSLVLLVISSILNYPKTTRLISLAILIYALYRAFSTNTYKRGQELTAFYNFVDKIASIFNKKVPRNYNVFRFSDMQPLFKNLKYRTDQWLNYKIVKCPSCGQKLRLPRKKGKITVTCRKCGTDFKMRT